MRRTRAQPTLWLTKCTTACSSGTCPARPSHRLPTEWAALADNPNVWRFKLREGVTFHDGAAFDSEDVVFSLNRAKQEGSEMQELLASVVDVRAVDAYTVDLETAGANPLMINNLTNMFIMDKGWAEANDVVMPQNVTAGETNYATMNTNGTGAFMLVSRSVDEKTVLKANPNYWGKLTFTRTKSRKSSTRRFSPLRPALRRCFPVKLISSRMCRYRILAAWRPPTA